MEVSAQSKNKYEYTFLSGGGEMGELIRSADWSQTPVGIIDTWPSCLRTLVSVILSSRFPMFLWWGNDLIQFYNDAYRPSLGNSGKHPHALGQKGKECWPETWEVIYPLIQKVLSGESTWSEDQLIPIYRNDRLEDVYWTFSYSPVRNDEGAINGVLVVCTETTKKVLSERHLKKQLSNLFIEAPIALCIFRGENHIVEIANERMLELWGKTSEQVLNKPVFEGLHDAKGQGFEELLDNVYKTGERFVAEELPVTLLRKDKMEDVFVKFVYEALHDEDGTISGIMAVADEITVQVLARKKIEESEQKFRIAIEGGGLGTYDFNPQTGELYWSEKTKEFFGLPPEAEVDYSIFMKGLHPDDRQRSDVAIQRAMDPKSGGLYKNEYRTVGITDGKLRWIRSKGKAVFDVDGKPVRFTGVTQDITKQKETLASLQVQSLVLQRMDEGVSVADEDGCIVFTNPAEDKMFGYAAGELIGKNVTIQNAYPPEENERIVGNVIEQLKSKGFWSGEWHNRKKDGTEFYTFSYITAVVVDGTTRFVCVQRDITEEKKTTDALIESEQRFRNLADESPIFIFIIDPDPLAPVNYWNKTWLTYTGQTAEEAAGRAWDGIIHPDDVTRVMQIYAPAFENKLPYFIPAVRTKRHDGEYRWYAFKGNPRYAANGEFNGYVGVGFDIHEQKLAEEKLKESEERFRTLAETLPQMIWVRNSDGQMEYSSKSWEEYSGIKNVSEAWVAMTSPDDYKRIMSSWKIAIEEGKPFRYEVRLKNKKGEYRWHSAAGEPVKDGSGEVVKYIGALTDIHEQKKALEQKDEFISIASHELKTPVTSLKGFTQILQMRFQKEDNKPAADLLSRMDKQVDKLTKLIVDLLDATKIENSQLQFTLEDFDFDDLVIEVVEEMKRTTFSHKINVQTGGVEIINGDRNRIGQVIINFISNAIKYSPDKHEIIVSTALKKGEVTLCVQDFGIGISDEKQPKIFERFFRVTGGGQETFPGLGLGLFISAEIIKRHKGTISVKSAEGKGSTFCFSLPLKTKE